VSLPALARIRIFSSMDHTLVCRLGGITERLHASCNHRERVCWRRPVSRDNCRALTASLPVSLSSIFCLYAVRQGEWPRHVAVASSPRWSKVQGQATTILTRGVGINCH